MRKISARFYLFVILFLSILASVAHAGPAGRVVWVKGTLTASGAGGTRSLARAAIFNEGDTLITDSSSQAQVVFADNSLMTFREGTRFRVDQEKVTPSGGTSIATLAEGGFRTITGSIASKTPDNYKIKTPVATIGVRGTEFIVYYKNGRLYVGRISGKPCVFDNIKRIQVCLTPQMPYVIVVAGEGSTVSSDMPSDLGGSSDLEIVPAVLQPSYPSGPNGPGGQVSSFCVT